MKSRIRNPADFIIDVVRRCEKADAEQEAATASPPALEIMNPMGLNPIPPPNRDNKAMDEESERKDAKHFGPHLPAAKEKPKAQLSLAEHWKAHRSSPAAPAAPFEAISINAHSDSTASLHGKGRRDGAPCHWFNVFVTSWWLQTSSLLRYVPTAPPTIILPHAGFLLPTGNGTSSVWLLFFTPFQLLGLGWASAHSWWTPFKYTLRLPLTSNWFLIALRCIR